MKRINVRMRFGVIGGKAKYCVKVFFRNMKLFQKSIICRWESNYIVRVCFSRDAHETSL